MLARRVKPVLAPAPRRLARDTRKSCVGGSLPSLNGLFTGAPSKPPQIAPHKTGSWIRSLRTGSTAGHLP